MRVLAPAKINLHLRVGRLADDGFHPLLSWMTTVGLFDILDFSLTSVREVRLSCDDPTIPTDSSNLICKVAMGLFEELDRRSRGNEEKGLSAALQKRIPVGAGLGGGSSDGAATILALARLLTLDWSHERLADLAARFGSDLPFFFHGPSSICTSRGGVVRPISPPKPRFAVMILPKMYMATPAVYRRFDEMGLGNRDAIEGQPDWKKWASLGAAELLPLLANDLEAPAFSLNPALAALHDQAGRSMGRIVRMSGSGSSLFTLADEEAEASELSARLTRDFRVRVETVPVCPENPET